MEKQVSVEKRVVRYRREKAENGEDSMIYTPRNLATPPPMTITARDLPATLDMTNTNNCCGEYQSLVMSTPGAKTPRVILVLISRGYQNAKREGKREEGSYTLSLVRVGRPEVTNSNGPHGESKIFRGNRILGIVTGGNYNG